MRVIGLDIHRAFTEAVMLKDRLAREAFPDTNVTRLMIIPGADMIMAVGLIAATAAIARLARIAWSLISGSTRACISLAPASRGTGVSPSRARRMHHAGLGSAAGSSGTWAAARLVPACLGPARALRRRGSGRAQARADRLAPAHAW